MGCMRDHWRKDGTTESCRGEPVVRRRHDRRRYLMKCRRESMPVELEWLEPDGLGGFASGTVAGHRTRRYHALLLAATTPPTGRMVLVNGFDAWLERPGLRGGRRYLTSQRYTPAVPTRGRPTHDRLHHAAVAHLDPSPGRRPRGELRAVRAAARRRRGAPLAGPEPAARASARGAADRKSTRLNSS